MDNYIMINGNKIELTEEQVKQITGKNEKNIFEPEKDENYYAIETCGNVYVYNWDDIGFDKFCKANYNCCTDKAYMENLRLEQLLYRQLKQFSYLHGWDDDVYGHIEGKKYYNHLLDTCYEQIWKTSWTDDYFNPNVVYFTSEEIAQEALETIIKPFYQEYPNFQPWVKR